MAALLDAGAERVTIALDAACERIYREAKRLVGAGRCVAGSVRPGAFLGASALTSSLAGRDGTRADRTDAVGARSRRHHRSVRLYASGGRGLGRASAAAAGLVSRAQAARWLIIHDLARAEGWRY